MANNLGKRGQVTAFIIVGIVIVLVAVVIVMVTRTDVDVGRISSGQVEPIKKYIEECIDDPLTRDVSLLMEHNTKFEPSNFFIEFGSNKINYLYTRGSTPRNKMLTHSFIRNRIKVDIEESLRLCDFSEFEDSFDIQIIGGPEVDVLIGEGNVGALVKYPLEIRKDGQTLELNEFTANVESDFGLMYGTIKDIIDSVILNGDFDLNNYLSGHSDVSIIRNRVNNFLHIYVVSKNIEDEDKEKIEFAVGL